MSAQVEFKIYVLVKPTEERILYKSLDSALRAAACQIGSEVEEWHALADEDRMRLIRTWDYRRTGFVTGLADMEAVILSNTP